MLKESIVTKRVALGEEVAARGLYEVAAYQAFATVKSNIATSVPTPINIAAAALAAADATKANSIRLAKNAYENAVSVAGDDKLTRPVQKLDRTSKSNFARRIFGRMRTREE